MKIRANILRYCNVLPSRQLAEYSTRTLKAVRFLLGFLEAKTWYEAEQFVQLEFDTPDEAREPDDTQGIKKLCGQCGACCKAIPTHQIGIYMSGHEYAKASDRFPNVEILQGEIESDGAWFGVVNVKENGDCIMLGEQGCTLGDDRPLWCKMYHCEKFQGRQYPFEPTKEMT